MQSAGVTPRQLPARQPLSLDTLVARAAAAPSTRVATKPVAHQVADYRAPSRRNAAFGNPAPRTLADLERASSIAEHTVRSPTPPSALALWVTIATCTCGRVHRLPPTTVLIKYAENEHSFHYARDDAALATLPIDLPREIREKSITIPYCESCFK